jgi:hypothetical protein
MFRNQSMSYRIRLDVYWQEQYMEDLLSSSAHPTLEEAESAFFNLFATCCTRPHQYCISLFKEEDEMQHLLKRIVVGKSK